MLRRPAMLLCAAIGLTALEPWPLFDIDRGQHGADGVKLADFDGDGWMDVVTAWEESGVTRIAFHPGHGDIHRLWPSVTIAASPAAEDAQPVDVDGDGDLDVIIACEGSERRLLWAVNPGGQAARGAWQLRPLLWPGPPRQWMFATVLGSRLAVGAKGDAAAIELATLDGTGAVREHRRLRRVAWTMTLLAEDLDGDGHEDLLFSDRHGADRALGWFDAAQGFTEHLIDRDAEFMFATVGLLNGRPVVAAAVKPREIRIYATQADTRLLTVPFPPQTGTAKAVQLADIDGDGRTDLVISCEQADSIDKKHGLFALLRRGETWAMQDIGGLLGKKFDLFAIQDVDGDGDLDVIACEEREIDAVFWYANPLLGPVLPGSRDTTRTLRRRLSD